MKIQARNDNGVWRLHLKGRLDAPWVGAFKRAMASYLNESVPHFILDLSELEYIDSTGLGAVLSLLRKVEFKGGSLRLQNLNSEMESLLFATRLNKLLPVETEGIADLEMDGEETSKASRPLWLS